MTEQRLIDANELRGIESLLNTDVIRGSKEASWLISQVLHDIDAMPAIDPETLPIVKQLREELTKVTAERDAAVHDLEEINDCSYCANNCVSEDNFCEFCGVENCLCRGCIGGGNWTWSGLQKEIK